MLGWRKDKREESDPDSSATSASPASRDAAPGAKGSSSASAPAPAEVDPSRGGQSKRLGEMLRDEGHITPAQLQEALSRQAKDGSFIGKALVDLGFVDRKVLQSFLVKQCKIPHISLLDYDIKSDLLTMVPEELCLRCHLLPIDKLGKILTVAMVDPLDAHALNEVRAVCPDLRIKPILCDWDHFATVSQRLFSKQTTAPQELTAKSLGLSDAKPKAPKEAEAPKEAPKPAGKRASADAEQAAVEAAVEALLQDAQAPPVKMTKKTANAEAELADLLARQKPPEPAAASGGESAPASGAPESAPAAASASGADLAAVVRSSVREAVQEATSSAMRAASPAPVPVTELAAQMREGMEEVMRQAMSGLAAQLREMAPPAPASPGPSPQEMAALMQQNLQDALRQTLAPVLESLREVHSADKGISGPSAAELASAIGSSVREAVQGAIGHVSTEIHRAADTAADGPSPQELAGILQEGIRGALQEAVAAITVETRQSLLAQAKAQPTPDQLAEKIRDSVHDAMQDVVAALADQTRAVAASRPVGGGEGPSPQALSDAIRTGVQEAMSAALEQQARHLAAADAREDGPSPEELSDAVRAGVQEAMSAALEQQARHWAAVNAGDDGPSPEALAAAVRAGVQEALSVALEQQARHLAAVNAGDDGPSPEELAAALGSSVRGALETGMKGLAAELATAVRPDDAPWREALAQQAQQSARTAQDMRAALDAMREAMQASQQAQVEREARLATLLEAALKPAAAAPPPPPLPPAPEEAEPARAGKSRKATAAASEKYASVTVLSRGEADTADLLRSPDVLEHSDERVRAALEAENPFAAFTFDGYYVGKSNAFTFALAKAVAESPGGEYNPLFVYGDVGTGKTHLVNAIANHARKINRDLRVGYVQAGRFARRLAEAARDDALETFREGYCRADMLLFDDVQFLAGNDEVQEEFFHIFNALQLENRQIILASDKAPDRLGGLEKRLVSRFTGGIVASLTAPDWETRLRILRRQAEEGQVEVPDDILALIATRVPSDIRKMSGCLRKLIAFAKLVDKDLTCDLAGQILTHLGVGEAA